MVTVDFGESETSVSSCYESLTQRHQGTGGRKSGFHSRGWSQAVTIGDFLRRGSVMDVGWAEESTYGVHSESLHRNQALE